MAPARVLWQAPLKKVSVFLTSCLVHATIYNMKKPITFSRHPLHWRHPKWGKLQLRYFVEDCKIRREKNIEDYIVNNGVRRVHVIKDNQILDDFFEEYNIQLTEPEHAELVVITDQRFSRLSAKNMLIKLDALLAKCPRVYFTLNRYYLNANESIKDTVLPEHYDHAITEWFTNNLDNAIVLNRSEIFVEDGSCFTWVVPSCELLICKK